MGIMNKSTKRSLDWFFYLAVEEQWTRLNCVRFWLLWRYIVAPLNVSHAALLSTKQRDVLVFSVLFFFMDGIVNPLLHNKTHGSSSVIRLQFFYFFYFMYRCLLLIVHQQRRDGWVLCLALHLYALSWAVTRVRTFLALVTTQNELGLFLFMSSSTVPLTEPLTSPYSDLLHVFIQYK